MKGLKEEEIAYLFKEAADAKSGGASLSKVFADFANEKKLAKGTVRNLYYEYLKKFESDESLREKYLGDKPLKVEKIVEFDKVEARWLLKKILLGATFGKPVRRTVLEITDDAKKALRYQNKYRNMIKNDEALVEEVSAEIKSEYGRCFSPYGTRREDATLKRLKNEINDLYAKIAKTAREENVRLKEKISCLEEENERLKNIVEKRETLKKYFGEDNFVGGKIHKEN